MVILCVFEGNEVDSHVFEALAHLLRLFEIHVKFGDTLGVLKRKIVKATAILSNGNTIQSEGP